MKKLIALVMCLCLVLSLLAGCGQSTAETDTEDAAAAAAETAGAVETAETAGEEETEAEEVTPIGMGGTGFETYPADMVVATVNGTDVTWMEYFYWLRYYTNYIQQLAASYGFVMDDWDGYDLSSENTNADVVIMNAQATVTQDHAILSETAKLGIELTEEDEAELLSFVVLNADSITGDGDGVATEEELAAFDEYLANEMLVDRAFFDQYNAIDLLSSRAFVEQYGENGEKLSDEDVMTFAEDSGLMGAKHILLLTVDTSTFEALSDEEIAEKRQRAEDLLAELQAVADDPDALEALFDELTAEYTEDTGYAAYPDGYVFGEGEMVSAFEDAVKALEVGGLSEVVESEYGYHIILRIPVDPDAIIGTDSNGNDVSLRYAAAYQQFSAQISDWVDAAEVVWTDGFETPDLAAIFG